MPEYDAFDELDRQVEEESAQNSRFKDLLMLKDGDLITFRILMEALPFVQIKEHSHFEKGNRANCFQAVCGAETGEPCYYCAQYEKTGDKTFKTRLILAYPVFIQDAQNPRATPESKAFLTRQVGQQKLLVIKIHGKQTQHHIIRDYYRRCGTVLSSEWQYSRRGSDENTTYTLAGYPSSPNGFTIKSDQEVRAMFFSIYPPKIVTAETEERRNADPVPF